MKDPAFLFYTKDFISGTQDMSVCEVGAYIRLLCYQHQHGHIPTDHERLMRITGIFDTNEFYRIWQIVKTKFKMVNEMDNQMVNERLNEVVNERSTAKPKKIAAACLAGLISSNQVSKEIVLKIKRSFDINSFISDNQSFNEDDLKNKIKDWFYNMVNQMVNNLANANANANEDGNKEVNEIEVFDLKQNPKKSKSGKSKLEVLPKHHDEMMEVLETFNKVLGTNFTTVKTFENNYEFWRNEYTFDQIIEAIHQIPKSKFWSEAATPEKIFRRSNTRGEVANYISDLLNLREKTPLQSNMQQVGNAALSYISKLK